MIENLLTKVYHEGLRWVLKSNLFTIALDKHLVECTQVTSMMVNLKQDEDKSTPVIPPPYSEHPSLKSQMDEEPHLSSVRSPVKENTS